MWINYETAATLADKSTEIRTATLLACIGIEAFQLIQTLDFAEENHRTDIDRVIARLDTHFIGEVNETFERFKFNQRIQDSNETIDNYVSALRILIQSCNFGTLENSLLRDRIVIGVRDDATRKKLLQMRTLDLKQTIDICRASEASTRQVREMKPSEEVHKVQHVPRKQGSIRDAKAEKGRSKSRDQRFSSGKKSCKFCGREHDFKKELCKAYGQTCRKCNKPNHFASVCKSRHENIHYSEDVNFEEVLVLRSEQDYPKRLYAKLLINATIVEFQLDSGASVNVLPETTYVKALGRHTKLRPPSSALLMYDKSELKTLGIVHTRAYNPKTRIDAPLEFYVVPNQKQAILGAAACQLLQLITVRTENILAMDSKQPQRREPLTRERVIREFHDVFSGNGRLEGDVHLETDPSTTPVKLPLRRLPIAIKDKVKAELDTLTRDGIVSPMNEPSDWISALLITTKPSGQIRICIDPKPLNRCLKRSHYPLAVIDDIIPQLQEAKIFTKVDVKNAFWHVTLDDASSALTTFETPYGRYRWNRLPMGISVSSELFQRKLNEALSGLQGIATIADDILIYGRGKTTDEATRDHDDNLLSLLQRCREKKICLNESKFDMHRESVAYMGHRFTANGLQPDPAKTEAINNMPPPKDAQGVQRLLGTVNYLAKFVPRMSEITAPLRTLIRCDVEWNWSSDIHGRAFDEIKRLLREAPVLKYFDSQRPTIVQCDASQSGLGCCLMQDGRPVAYASRALTATEQNYAQIEKETLAIVFAMEKFHTYVYGRLVTVETDHKPLISIFSKALYNAPRRLQRMMLRLQSYQFSLLWKPGSEVIVADALSRAYPPDDRQGDMHSLNEEVATINRSTFERDLQAGEGISFIVASDNLKNTLREVSARDSVVNDIKTYINDGWPELATSLPEHLRFFHNYRDELVIEENMLLKGLRLYVPGDVRPELLRRIHSSHIGIQGCLRRAREAVFWPNMNKDITASISTCGVCAKIINDQSKEPMLAHHLPDRPWQRIACDLFEYNHIDYLITVDYYSNFFEVDRLIENKKAPEVIRHLKAHFSRYGLPDLVISDNGPPFNSAEFKVFASRYEFEHRTSSPRYPQSNGKAENAVKTAKNLMRKATEAHSDPYIALLDWRNTPSEGFDTSPTQRLLGRRVRTAFPMNAKLLSVPGQRANKRSMRQTKSKQAKYYNRTAQSKPAIPLNQTVRAKINDKTDWVKAEIVGVHPYRSYTIETEGGAQYRRNRKHVRFSKETPIIRADAQTDDVITESSSATQATQPTALPDEQHNTNQRAYVTRSGRTIRPPARLNDYVTA